jgi:DNA primase
MMDKEVLRQRIDIVDLIGKTVDLKKDGTRFKGLCPFHPDRKSLSLVVYPDTQTWQCFGCGKHGDAFQWVMELEKVDFLAALARLQEQYGDTERSTTNTTVWNVTDVDGNLIAQHFRYDHPDGTKTYSWNGQDGLGGIKAGELPLYGVKHLFAMETAAVNSIVIVEGEKATDALVKAGYATVGPSPGPPVAPIKRYSPH